jgi:hypothetical protein
MRALELVSNCLGKILATGTLLVVLEVPRDPLIKRRLTRHWIGMAIQR